MSFLNQIGTKVNLIILIGHKGQDRSFSAAPLGSKCLSETAGVIFNHIVGKGKNFLG